MGIQDQGWGNLKGAIDMKLTRGLKDANHVPVWEWHNDGSGTFNDTVKREVVVEATHDYQMVIREFDEQSDFVRNYKNGDGFELWYKVGGGGGHELQISRPSIEFVFENEEQDKVEDLKKVEIKKEIQKNLESNQGNGINDSEEKKKEDNCKKNNMNFFNSFMDNDKLLKKDDLMSFCKNKFIDNKLLGKIGEIIKNEVSKEFNKNVKDQNEV